MRNNLINFRHELGLSQTDLGGLFGLKKQQISKIENGRQEGSADFWLDMQEKFCLTNEATKKLKEVQPDKIS